MRAGDAMTPEQTRELTGALEVVADPAGKDLGAALDTIERIAKEAGSGIDARLNHFLSGRSYGKALAWLKERAAGKGRIG